MTIRHIKIFLAVWENGCNTTRAAEALHMTQPAVSLAIRELEDYYGVALFDRIGRRLRITEAGIRFGEYAAHISALFDEMEQGIRNWDSLGILRVGASITVGSHFLPEYVKAFRKMRPAMEIRALVAPSDLLERKVLDNELDLALIEGIPHSPALVSKAYMVDSLCVIAPVGGDFYPGQVLSLEALKKQKFLLREPGSGTREVFDRAIQSAGFSVEPVWEAMSTTALIHAVMNGLGVSVLPKRLVEEHSAAGKILMLNVEGLDFSRSFQIIWHKEKHLTVSAKAFIDLCCSYQDTEV